MEEEYDFGFSSFDEEEFNSVDKAKEMYDAIMPLLLNLRKDSDKNPYIHWPNRQQKINEFIQRLNTILNS